MTILITGAAGFIGAHVAAHLAENGCDLVLVDNYSDYYSIDLKRRRTSALGLTKVIEDDLSDLERLINLLKTRQVSQVIHLAAQAGVRVHPSIRERYVGSNLTGFANVLLAAIETGVPDFIYASSSSVYGNCPAEVFDERQTGLAPISLYGATKLSNEEMAASASRELGIRTRGLRYFTVYGPWGRPDMAYLRLVNSAINKRVFNVFGDGSMIRDLTFIDDAVDATIRLVENLGRQDSGFADVVNVGGGDPRSLKETISILECELKSEIKLKFSSVHVADVKKTVAGTGYLSSLVDYVPLTRQEEGLREVVNWIRDPKVSSHLAAWVDSVR